MVRPRIELHHILKDLLGSSNVYFQPPESVQLKYPCIIYNRDQMDTQFATNSPYTITARYQVTAIYRDPDDELPFKIACLPMCLFDRHFTADNLNHDIFNLYF